MAAIVLILVVGTGPVVGQDAVGLRAAVLYGVEMPDGDRVAGGDWAQRAVPLRGLSADRRARADTTLADPWLGRDKALHAAGSFLLTLSAQYVLTAKLDTDEATALPIAAGATLSLGLAKEVADSRRPVRPLFSPRDLVADAVGVALAVGLILL